MKINFDAKVNFNGTYNVENGTLNVNVTDGNVTLEYLPLFTTGYLRVADEDLFGENNCTDPYITTTTASTYNLDDYDEDIAEYYDDEDEEDVEEDLDYLLARKIAKYDKDGQVTKLLIKLLNMNTTTSKKITKNITRIMTDLTDMLSVLKEKMQEE